MVCVAGPQSVYMAHGIWLRSLSWYYLFTGQQQIRLLGRGRYETESPDELGSVSLQRLPTDCRDTTGATEVVAGVSTVPALHHLHLVNVCLSVWIPDSASVLLEEDTGVLLTMCSSFILLTWPYHFSRFSVIFLDACTTLVVPLMCSFRMLSLLVTPHIYLSIRISFSSSRDYCPLVVTHVSTPYNRSGAKTINVFRACLGAQLTTSAQKWRNFVLFSTVSLIFVLSRVCVFLYSLGPWSDHRFVNLSLQFYGILLSHNTPLHLFQFHNDALTLYVFYVAMPPVSSTLEPRCLKWCTLCSCFLGS